MDNEKQQSKSEKTEKSYSDDHTPEVVRGVVKKAQDMAGRLVEEVGHQVEEAGLAVGEAGERLMEVGRKIKSDDKQSS